MSWRFYGVIVIFQLCYIQLINGQAGVGADQPPIGAHKVFAKTTFQCVGRPSGYYADIDTGCQVYHMCDGLGRQFSYTCPNTTLFQQRMLICDHWYMVNCTNSESNYAANLLIGQRDKPFVTEAEHELRTPRPDLLDRPYAPDYAGESFRNNYKTILQTPIQNAINDIDYTKEFASKKAGIQQKQTTAQQQFVLPTRWSTLHPTRFDSTTPRSFNFNKPFINNNNINNNNIRRTLTEEGNFIVEAQRRNTNENDDIFVDLKNKILSSTPSSLSLSLSSPSILSTSSIDLGVSSSQDAARTIADVNGNNLQITQTKSIETPSIYFTAPSLPQSQSESQSQSSTITKSVDLSSNKDKPKFNIHLSELSQSTGPTNFVTTSTESPSQQQQQQQQNTQFKITFGKPFENKRINGNKFDILKENFNQQQNRIFNQESRILSNGGNSNNNNNQQQLPSTDLLPPFENLIIHDGSTQGPPIYYEWKIPFDTFEVPNNGDDDDNNNNDEDRTKRTKLPSQYFQLPLISKDNLNINKQSSGGGSSSGRGTGTSLLSLKQLDISLDNRSNNGGDDGNDDDDDVDSSTAASSFASPSSRFRTGGVTPDDINNLKNWQKQHSVPEFIFPLENTHNRQSYKTDSNSVNSFQIKIPETINKHWFGENAECPECHPAFTKPGTCSPCIKL